MFSVQIQMSQLKVPVTKTKNEQLPCQPKPFRNKDTYLCTCKIDKSGQYFGHTLKHELKITEAHRARRRDK